MKLIKSIVFFAITMFASTVMYAQEMQVKTEIAKPIGSTIPPIQQPVLAAPSVAGEFTGGGHQQARPQTTPQAKPAVEKNEEMAKPVQATAKNAQPVPEIITEKRSDAKRPVPMIPAENINLVPTPPAKQTNKPVPTQQQQ